MTDETRTQVVVVTGASAGVGRATARAFADTGARIGLLARGRQGLDAARAEIEAAGGEAIAIPTDVADAAAVDAAAERVERKLGPIDVWANVAMVTVFSPFADITAEEYRRVTEVTYLGQVHGTMAALKRMRPRDRGSIVNVGSALGFHGLPLQAAYCGAKFAIRGFTEAVRAELIHENSGVRLSMVVLPAVNTPQFDWARNKLMRRVQPAPPIYQPEIPAEAILRVVQTGEREVCVGSSSAQVMLGSWAASGYLDRKMAEVGYQAQQTGQPAWPKGPDNLFEPVEGDFGAHGRFDDRARAGALQMNTGGMRASLATCGAALLVLAGVAGYALASRHPAPDEARARVR